MVTKGRKHSCLCPGRDWPARAPGKTKRRVLAALMVEGVGVRCEGEKAPDLFILKFCRDYLLVHAALGPLQDEVLC